MGLGLLWCSEMLTIDQVEKFMGQNVKDEYGRVIGKLLTAYTDISGKVESVEIALNDYELERVEAERIKLTPDGLVISPRWKVRAVDVENKLDRVRRRIRSVEELYRKGMIPGHAYEDMKRRLNAQFKRVKDEVVKIKEELRKRANALEDQIIRLEKDMSNLMVLYMSNEVGETSYKAAIELLRNAKIRNADEKRDVERHIELIQKLEAEASEPLRASQDHTESIAKAIQGSPIQVQVVDTNQVAEG